MSAENFTCIEQENAQTIEIRMEASYKTPEWERLEKFCHAKIEAGVRNIDMDLTAVEMIDSRFLGQVVGLNTRLLTKQGRLKVIVKPESKIENIFKLTKLDQILVLERFRPRPPAAEEHKEPADAEECEPDGGGEPRPEAELE